MAFVKCKNAILKICDGERFIKCKITNKECKFQKYCRKIKDFKLTRASEACPMKDLEPKNTKQNQNIETDKFQNKKTFFYKKENSNENKKSEIELKPNEEKGK